MGGFDGVETGTFQETIFQPSTFFSFEISITSNSSPSSSVLIRFLSGAPRSSLFSLKIFPSRHAWLSVRPRYLPLPYQDAPESGRLVLRDGTTATVRLARPTDLEGMARFFGSLSQSSRMNRLVDTSLSMLSKGWPKMRIKLFSWDYHSCFSSCAEDAIVRRGEQWQRNVFKVLRLLPREPRERRRSRKR